MSKINVILADDHEMVREGLAQLLAESEGINVIGQAENGHAALEVARQTNPDVVILDYSMPKLDGFSAIAQFRSLFPKTKILILTIHENIQYAIKVLEAKAHGYVVKAAAVQELVEAIRQIHAGRIYLSPRISEKIAEHLQHSSQRTGLEALSQREFELLRHLSTGMSLQDAARIMHISTSTASTYRSRLLKKLHLKTTAELIRFALDQEIID